MRSAILAALAAVCLATSAGAQQFPDLTFTDLNGAHHDPRTEWHAQGGVLVLGFSHDARDAMDNWVSALNLNANDQWLEAPVIGDINGLIRPMIRSGMRTRYDDAQRRHVTPVFEGADTIRSVAAPNEANVVVLVIGTNGDIIAHVRGVPTEANLHLIRTALPDVHGEGR